MVIAGNQDLRNYSLSANLPLTLSNILPQIWTNWRRHDSESLPHMFFLSWAIAGVPLGVTTSRTTITLHCRFDHTYLFFLAHLIGLSVNITGKGGLSS